MLILIVINDKSAHPYCHYYYYCYDIEIKKSHSFKKYNYLSIKIIT